MENRILLGLDGFHCGATCCRQRLDACAELPARIRHVDRRGTCCHLSAKKKSRVVFSGGSRISQTEKGGLGVPTPEFGAKAYYILCRKLYENERNCIERGRYLGRASPVFGSANVISEGTHCYRA